MKQKKKKKKGLIAGVGSIVLMILVTLVKPDILGAFIQTVGNYLIHKDELKITDEKECKVEIDESYSEYIKTHEHLREDIILKICILSGLAIIEFCLVKMKINLNIYPVGFSL